MEEAAAVVEAVGVVAVVEDILAAAVEVVGVVGTWAEEEEVVEEEVVVEGKVQSTRAPSSSSSRGIA